jgi:hypothetical protein
MKAYAQLSPAVEQSSQRRAPMEGIVPLTVQKEAMFILANISLNHLRR